MQRQDPDKQPDRLFPAAMKLSGDELCAPPIESKPL